MIREGRGKLAGTILVDFDGTVSKVDVGNRLFHRITRGAWEDVVDEWKAGTISSRECLIRECALSRATKAEVREFALAQPIDAGFASFVELVEANGWRVRIVSDGLEFYITTILGREGLERVPVEANLVHFAGNRLMPAFPFAGRGCGRCGNCKAGAVQEARAAGPVWFVGDGLSDRCGAEIADRVYAKSGRDLAAYCRDRKLPHVEFDDFGAVAAALIESEGWAPLAGAVR